MISSTRASLVLEQMYNSFINSEAGSWVFPHELLQYHSLPFSNTSTNRRNFL